MEIENNQLAVLMHTFFREEKLFKSIHSILSFLPNVKIYLTDGSFGGKHKNFERKEQFYKILKRFKHTIKILDYDTSPAKARNLIIPEIKERYILKLDDDFVITETSNILNALQIMKEDDNVDILGLSVCSHQVISPFVYHVNKYERTEINLKLNRDINMDVSKKGLLYFKVDVTPDCFICKKSVFPKCNWDERYHVGEGLHTDFFLNIKYNTEFNVYYCPSVVVKHLKHGVKYEDKVEYRQLRNRNKGKNTKLLKKWGVSTINKW